MASAGSFPSGHEAAVPDLFEGTVYRSIRRLGAGGMGEVHLVEHTLTGRELVAKVLHERLASDARLLERLRIEAQALGQLNHEHIVSIVGFDRVRGGTPFFVMEYLEGRSLEEELESRNRLPVFEAVTFACQLLSALAATHAKGIVHRDVKPANLFLCARPDGTRSLKVLDFGVARVLPESTAVAPLPLDLQTQTGIVLGTPRFVSPEGAMGQRVDPRADLYAAGLVLYVMLVGRGPFDHVDGDAMLLSAHAIESPEPPSRYAEEPVPPELDRVVLKALAKDPNERFQNAGEFRDVLLQVVDLLRRPAGWAETSTYSARETSSSPPPSARPRFSGDAIPDPSAPDPEPSVVSSQPVQRARGPVVLSPRAAIFVFMLCVLVAGLAAVAVLRTLRGG